MQNLKPHLALILCNTIWALDYPLYSLLLPHYLSPLALVTASLVVTAFISYVPLLWSKAEPIARRDYPMLLLAALLVGVVRKLLLMYGLSLTSPIDGSIISTLSPIAVLIISVMVGIDRFTMPRLVGLLIAVVGVVAIILFGSAAQQGAESMVGNMLILLDVVATAVYMVWFKSLVGRYRTTTILRWIYTIAAVVSLPFGAHDVLRIDVASMSPHILLALAFVLVMPTYIPNLLLNYSLGRVQPTVSSVYGYLQPLIAIGVSVWMGLDKFSIESVLFGAVTLVGVTLVIRSYRRRSQMGESVSA